MRKFPITLLTLLLISGAAHAQNIAIACTKLRSGGTNWIPTKFSVQWNGKLLQSGFLDGAQSTAQEPKPVISYKAIDPTRKSGTAISFFTGRSADGKYRHYTTIDVLPSDQETEMDFMFATLDSTGYLITAHAIRFGGCVVAK